MGLRIDGIGEGYDVWHGYSAKGGWKDSESMPDSWGEQDAQIASAEGEDMGADPFSDFGELHADGIGDWKSAVASYGKDLAKTAGRAVVSKVGAGVKRKLGGGSKGGGGDVEERAPKKAGVPWLPIALGVGGLAIVGVLFSRRS